jgi:hypothetical protein
MADKNGLYFLGTFCFAMIELSQRNFSMQRINAHQNVTNKDSTPFVLTLTLGTSIPSSSKMVAE